MEIQLESAEPHTIRSYSDHSILVGDTTLYQSCIISKHSIQIAWPIQHIDQLDASHIPDFLPFHPDVVLLGHAGPPQLLPLFASELSQQKIGLECMSIGAACRTFNVLLSEYRNVVLGIIFEKQNQVP